MTNVPYSTTTDAYDMKYKTGYGHEHPDGHVVRIHRHILQHELGLRGGKILDYGCGTGVYLDYFTHHGFEPYGCDISDVAIQACKARLPKYAANMHVIPSVPDLSEIFPGDFDLVFSNQTLYYLKDSDLHEILKQLHGRLKSGGAFYASMMSTGSYYAKRVEGTSEGLSKVVLRGRLEETTFMSFWTREKVQELFESHGFEKVQLGYYAYLIREDEGPREHHFFVGRKK